jgi:hypothetical protein
MTIPHLDPGSVAELPPAASTHLSSTRSEPSLASVNRWFAPPLHDQITNWYRPFVASP